MTKKLGWNNELKRLKRASDKDYSVCLAVATTWAFVWIDVEVSYAVLSRD